ncbi:MAG TPA: hypothetical protein PLH07_01580 [Sulfurovum sp.]|nr:MAG: hypothetical protein B7Y63_07070 [Sulfurovum sp. 35-42-20]OYY55337.1 MAG: hypothetical protein B7Y52_05735 [Sulfurovum sp. 28-43-6]OYZ25637.1 MAG: hypothetical protein B7Y23_04515 [Sulfurovum sp. 16-42-52]OYZ49746.1 MAG: hypothetical protein B7Y13_03515 [Sulfurovum sp. 24-42-9]OZA45755.1 MAG: hypothetical protein B7X80_04155 [Sulfurovum sp. 17-42-90]OZA59731.1 MAG: hypothetical protein B7X69_06955 [Sulfurovum sp. 39-42-12]HQR73862.1 hypothetical protein [Sulfurovum sp.]
MKPHITTLALTLMFSTFSLAAERYDTGALRTVQKHCTSCHGTPFFQAKQIDDSDWKFFFNTEGELEKIHKDKPEALANLASPSFKQKKKRILKFFIENSMYSGSVNGCDGNFCGTNH